jgi:hypothetical protein
MSAYTIESLIPDCVGRYITSDTGNVKLSDLINGRTYGKCWQSFTSWVGGQFENGTSSNLAPLGIIIRGDGSEKFLVEAAPDSRRQRPAAFRFLNSFLNRFNLRVKSGLGGVDESDYAALRMNLAALSKSAGVDGQTFRIALTHIFRRIGDVLSEQAQLVSIDFTIGQLVSDHDGQVDFVFNAAPPGKPAVPTEFMRAQKMYNMETQDKHATPRTAAISKDNTEASFRLKYPIKSTFTSTGIPNSGEHKQMSKEDGVTLPELDPTLLSPEVTQGLVSRADGLHNLSTLPRRLTSRPAAASLVTDPATNALPHTSVIFRRTLQGRAPLENVRVGLEAKQLSMETLTFDTPTNANVLPAALTRQPDPLRPMSPAGVKPAAVASPRGVRLSVAIPEKQPAVPKTLAFPPTLVSLPAPLPSKEGAAAPAAATRERDARPFPGMAAGYGERAAESLADAALKASSPRKERLKTEQKLKTDTAAAAAAASRAPLVSTALPPVLDAFARTRASPYSGQQSSQPLSGKIASFYTPEAGQWTFSIEDTTGLKETEFLDFLPEREVPTLSRLLARAHYVTLI